jgi:hypothetical protein
MGDCTILSQARTAISAIVFRPRMKHSRIATPTMTLVWCFECLLGGIAGHWVDQLFYHGGGVESPAGPKVYIS